ncbi:hypothetical protein M501DRAFT_1002365 [Patellaria atrata CBS 101060]|uniref:Uncharacterized protein n=1 Tax=Patellaria atrata CBS 101060 TaxID=1346257 RepID=A0A9P4SDZ8_9PEZI|nr:hypothetical protein M501DRAFT_1002365 [Patellaria atrata CBS 101060]
MDEKTQSDIKPLSLRDLTLQRIPPSPSPSPNTSRSISFFGECEPCSDSLSPSTSGSMHCTLGTEQTQKPSYGRAACGIFCLVIFALGFLQLLLQRPIDYE